uniref:Uncharacterized protein n=1 Tax=Acrobeloides nanus TaxID=290746 RepID=A0A914E879_9BILA
MNHQLNDVEMADNSYQNNPSNSAGNMNEANDVSIYESAFETADQYGFGGYTQQTRDFDEAFGLQENFNTMNIVLRGGQTCLNLNSNIGHVNRNEISSSADDLVF